jgi:hypothetical protein
MEWTLPRFLQFTDPLDNVDFSGNRMGIAAKVGNASGRLICERLVYEFRGAEFSLEQREPGTFELGANAGKFAFKKIQGRPPRLPGPIKSYAFPDLAKTNYQNADFLAEFEAAYESQMDSIFHLGPLREHPQRQYGWAGSRPSDVGRRGQQVVEAILSATARREMQNLRKGTKRKPFQEVIAHWLQVIGLIEAFEVEEIGRNSNLYRARVQIDRFTDPVSITEVGFGVSQVLPVIVLLHYVPEGSTVILEQPEIHLHPSVQSGLADVLVHAALHRNVQVIVESHSEHLLRRLQRRIAENDLDASQARLYFCRRENGLSILEPLRVNEYGAIKNWPKHFFGDEMGEIAATEKARLKKQAAAE